MLKISGVFLILLMTLSCTKDKEITVMKSVNSSWNKKQKQEFQFDIKDAENAKNIIFVVRNNNDYPFSNIRFIVNFTSPNKNIKTDTLNFILAEPNGEWIGSGFGETKETLFQYKLNYKLPTNGLYKIAVTQAMRKNILPGIEDFGVKIEQAKP